MSYPRTIWEERLTWLEKRGLVKEFRVCQDDEKIHWCYEVAKMMKKADLYSMTTNDTDIVVGLIRKLSRVPR